MAKNTLIRIQMKGRIMEAAALGYVEIVNQMENENAHVQLLREHAIAMRDKLEDFCNKEQMNYTLILNRTEALAVWQTLQMKFALTPYAATGLRKIGDHIDNSHKSATWIVER